MRKSSATGFVAQEKLMTYATPQIIHLTEGFLTWDAARYEAGLDWEPTLANLRPEVNGEPGQIILDTKAVMNGDHYISVASSRYELINHDLFGDVVAAVRRSYNDATITALVVLDGGRRVGARVTHGEMLLPFDSSPISKETWIWLRHDTKGALYIVENAHRMRCTNALGWLDRGIETDLRVRHTGNVEEKINHLITRFTERADWTKWEAEMSKMSLTHVSVDMFDEFIADWIPIPEDPQANTTRAERARGTMWSLWEGYKNELGPNLYSAYQAITEYEDQHRTARGAAGMFNRAIQPNPRKKEALDALRALATV